MAHGPTYRVQRRRRREGRTDYRQRLGLLRSERHRAIVRRQSRNTIVQLARFEPTGDIVVAQAEAHELAKLGWNGHTGNLPAAYLTGFLAGRRAVAAGVTDAVLDLGLQLPRGGTSLFAALRGLVDAGIDVPHGDEVVPDQARLNGEHISEATPALVADVKARIEEATS